MTPQAMDLPGALTARGYDSPRHGHIADLPIVRGCNGALYSAWRPSWRELWRLFRGEPMILGILAEGQPPVIVEVGIENVPVDTRQP